jgi:hypothetical protein
LRSKDWRNKAEKHHFGKRRVGITQKSLANRNQASGVANNDLTIRLKHVTRDATSETMSPMDLFDSKREDNGAYMGYKGSTLTNASRPLKVLDALSNDPTGRCSQIAN